jgi:hypothetical protein
MLNDEKSTRMGGDALSGIGYSPDRSGEFI